jgi:hypothetical protein
MGDAWTDDDCPKVRETFGHLLRAHVRHQDGRDSLAPSVIFADYDYEVGDGRCGLWSDAKNANEPAIVYARADALIDALAHIKALEAQLATARADGYAQGVREAADRIHGFVISESAQDTEARLDAAIRDFETDGNNATAELYQSITIALLDHPTAASDPATIATIIAKAQEGGE